LFQYTMRIGSWQGVVLGFWPIGQGLRRWAL
jgi:hypothetical protein